MGKTPIIVKKTIKWQKCNINGVKYEPLKNSRIYRYLNTIITSCLNWMRVKRSLVTYCLSCWGWNVGSCCTKWCYWLMQMYWGPKRGLLVARKYILRRHQEKKSSNEARLENAKDSTVRPESPTSHSSLSGLFCQLDPNCWKGELKYVIQSILKAVVEAHPAFKPLPTMHRSHRPKKVCSVWV